MAKPKVSLSDLTFIMRGDIGTTSTSRVRRGKDLELRSKDRFHIQIDHLSHLGVSKSIINNNIGIKWDVMYNEDEDNVVTIVDVPRGSLGSNSGSFIKELKAPQGLAQSGLVADVKVSFNGNLLDKISLKIFNGGDRKYINVDDTLRYFQNFFV